MKTLYKNISMMSILFIALFSLSSCMDKDEEIGFYVVQGHWFGDMDMYYNGERARGSELEFNTGWSYSRGTGVEIDYYRRGSITNYFDWEVHNRILYLTFDDPNLDCAIVDYSLTRDYFSGYIANPVTLENETYFNLRNYDRYWDSYGYGGYYSPYYAPAQTRAEADSIDTVPSDAAVTAPRGIRGVNMKKAIRK